MHIMLDFVTLGQDPTTKVVSLGAVAFNREGIISKKYWVYDLDLQPTRTEDPETVAWWAKQSPEARAVFKTPKDKCISIENMLADQDRWIESLSLELDEQRDKAGKWRDLKVWGNGANFDVVIMEDMIRTLHPKSKAGIPWAFWNVWCFRTFDKMTGIKADNPRNKKTHGIQVVAHNALDDAIWQTECLLKYWQRQKPRG